MHSVELPTISGNYDVTVRFSNYRIVETVSITLDDPHDEWEISRKVAKSHLTSQYAGEPFNIVNVRLSNDYMHHKLNARGHLSANEVIGCMKDHP